MKMYVSENTFIIEYYGNCYEFLNEAMPRLTFLREGIRMNPLAYYCVKREAVDWSQFREVK